MGILQRGMSAPENASSISGQTKVLLARLRIYARCGNRSIALPQSQRMRYLKPVVDAFPSPCILNIYGRHGLGIGYLVVTDFEDHSGLFGGVGKLSLSQSKLIP